MGRNGHLHISKAILWFKLTSRYIMIVAIVARRIMTGKHVLAETNVFSVRLNPMHIGLRHVLSSWPGYKRRVVNVNIVRDRIREDDFQRLMLRLSKSALVL